MQVEDNLYIHLALEMLIGDTDSSRVQLCPIRLDLGFGQAFINFSRTWAKMFGLNPICAGFGPKELGLMGLYKLYAIPSLSGIYTRY